MKKYDMDDSNLGELISVTWIDNDGNHQSTGFGFRVSPDRTHIIIDMGDKTVTGDPDNEHFSEGVHGR